MKLVSFFPYLSVDYATISWQDLTHSSQHRHHPMIPMKIEAQVPNSIAKFLVVTNQAWFFELKFLLYFSCLSFHVLPWILAEVFRNQPIISHLSFDLFVPHKISCFYEFYNLLSFLLVKLSCHIGSVVSIC